MAKKSFNEKLHNSKDLPKVKHIGPEDKGFERFGISDMLIAAPIEYDQVMKMIPKGKVITALEIREFLAKKHNADFTCHLTAGLFINISAKASQERETLNMGDLTPYWRTLKKGGELNEKYPGGIEQQRMFLESEGHEIIQKGKRYFVKDYENSLHQL